MNSALLLRTSVIFVLVCTFPDNKNETGPPGWIYDPHNHPDQSDVTLILLPVLHSKAQAHTNDKP